MIKYETGTLTCLAHSLFLFTQGVNAIDYFQGGDKPYIISAADDRLVKVWDYQNKTCVQTLEGHAQNVSCVIFHPELPIILSGSEDGEYYLDVVTVCSIREFYSHCFENRTSANKHCIILITSQLCDVT